MCDSFWQHIHTVRHVIYPSESIDHGKWSEGHTFGWHHHSSVLLPLCSSLLSPSLNLNLLATLQNGQPHFYCTVNHTSTIWAWAWSDAEGNGWLGWPGPMHDVWVHSECMIIIEDDWTCFILTSRWNMYRDTLIPQLVTERCTPTHAVLSATLYLDDQQNP